MRAPAVAALVVGLSAMVRATEKVVREREAGARSAAQRARGAVAEVLPAREVAMTEAREARLGRAVVARAGARVMEEMEEAAAMVLVVGVTVEEAAMARVDEAMAVPKAREVVARAKVAKGKVAAEREVAVAVARAAGAEASVALVKAEEEGVPTAALMAKVEARSPTAHNASLWPDRPVGTSPHRGNKV